MDKSVDEGEDMDTEVDGNEFKDTSVDGNEVIHKGVDRDENIDRAIDEDEICELLQTDEREIYNSEIQKKSDPRCRRDVSNNITLSPDGGWGWMIVLGSFFVHLLTDGVLYSFGILYIEFLDYYKGSKGETAWIGSIAIGLQLLTGPIGSVLTGKFGCRATAISGAILASLGFILSAFTPSLHFLYFSFGIISGLGFGLTYFPAVVSVGQYFENKLTLAVGLASCGSGIGAFILNPLSKYLIDEYGWRGALLILGGILLHCMLCGALFRPLRKKKQTEVRNTDAEVQNCIEKSEFSVKDNISGTRETSSLESLSDLESKYFDSQSKDIPLQTFSTKNIQDNKTENKLESSNNGKERNLVKLCNMVSRACNLSQFKDKIFITYLNANVLISASLNTPFNFLYDLATEMGVDEESGKWLGAIIGIANTIGRVFSGILADKLKLNKILMFSASMIIVGISTALCPLCSSFTSFVIFSCVFGLSFGIYIPLMSVVIVDILGKQMLANGFGLLLLLKGSANLIGPPMAGWLYDKTGSYDIPFIVAGFSLTIAGVMLAIAIFVKKRNNYKE